MPVALRALLVALPVVCAFACGHHHPTEFPPTGPSVRVMLDDQTRIIELSNIAHDGGDIALRDLWLAAWPEQDTKNLRFDLMGSDNFRPSSRPACKRPLSNDDMSAARLDLKTHDVSYPGRDLPGCYRVKAVVEFDALR